MGMSASGQSRVGVLANGEIHIAGGYLQTGAVSKLHYKFNPVTNVWTKLADLPFAVNGHYSGVYNDEFYVFGGYYVGTTGFKVYAYNANTDAWRLVTEESTTMGWRAGCIFKHWLVHLSGTTTSVLRICNLKTHEWTETPIDIPMRYAAELVPSHDGIILVGGCSDGSIGSAEYNAAPRFPEVYFIKP